MKWASCPRRASSSPEDVEAMVAAHLRHLDRERKRVVGILEQLVAVDHHGVEKQPGGVRGQTERPLVADEMGLVPAAGKLLTEGGGEDAAAPDRRVAGYADPQGPLGCHVRSGAL